MARKTFNIIKLLFIANMILILSSCQKTTVTEEKILRPVKVAKVLQAPQKISFSFNGISKASDEASLSFRQAGVIEKILVKVGQKVERDQLLALLDTSDIKLEIQQSEAQLKDALNQLGTSEANLSRIRSLYENDSVSLSDYEQAKNQYSSAESNYKTQEKRIELQKKSLSYHQIKAPFSGVISSVPVNVNEQVASGTAVIVLSTTKQIEMLIDIPETTIKDIFQGQNANIVFSSMREKTYKGNVSEISFNSSDLTTYPVSVQINNPDNFIRAGMPGRVTLDFKENEAKNQLSVPISSVFAEGNNTFVYKIQQLSNNEAKVVKTKVTTAKLTKDLYYISSGLDVSDIVVSAGITKLADQMVVIYRNSQE